MRHPHKMGTHISVYDNDTNTTTTPLMTDYTGPVAGLEHQFIAIGHDSLRITATAPNSFIHGGDGDDAIAVTSGNNVIDGGGGSNFLVGGSGNDTFFIDLRNATAPTWSTIVNLHQGDKAIVWGATYDMIQNVWMGRGAEGYLGQTFDFGKQGGPLTSVTITGAGGGMRSQAYIAFGSVDGTDYIQINAP